jgi:hypothetical protein
MDCRHEQRQELGICSEVIQRCVCCGMVREYNPKKKYSLPVSDPDHWSDWTQSCPEIDKYFLDNFKKRSK